MERDKFEDTLVNKLLSLYDAKTPNETLEKVLSEVYDPKVKYESPITKITGRDNLKLQITAAHSLCTNTNVGLIGHYYDDRNNRLVVAFIICNKIKYLPVRFEVLNTIVITLHNKKIILQEDNWSITHWIHNIPFVSGLFDTLRQTGGILCNLAVPVLTKKKEAR